MKSILIYLLLLLSLHTTAQELVIDTTRFVGGDSSCGASLSEYSIPTKDGGILFVGLTDCFAGGGDIPPSPPGTFANGDGGNVLVGKLDSNMNISWIKTYGGTQADAATGAVQTADGGYAILASTYSDDGNVSGNHGLGDLWLVRIDDTGKLLWQKCFGSFYDEQSGAIALAPDNGFILFGNSNGSGDDVPTHYSGSEFDYDWFVVKTDSMGNKQWAKSIGGTGYEQKYGSIIVANNAYYLVSSTNSTDYDCTDTAWCAGNAQQMNNNYYIFKLDTATGNILWDSSYGGSSSDIVYDAMWDSRDSSIVINGLTFSDDYMVTGNHGDEDMWVIKTDKNGMLKWEKCLGGSNDEEGTGIAIATTGYIAYGSTFPGAIGQQDAWLFALDNAGDTLDNVIFGGASYEDSYSIIPYKNGFAATGSSSSLSFTEGVNIGHPSEQIEDIFVSYINYWPLGVANINISNQQIAVYPNPSNGMIRILVPDQGNLTVSNILGQNIYNRLINQNELQIDINAAGWADGVYIIMWQGEDGGVLTTKLIKN